MGYLISLLLYNFFSIHSKEQGEYFWAFFASYFDTTETQIKKHLQKTNPSVRASNT